MLSVEDLENIVLVKEAQLCIIPFILMSVIGQSVEKEG